MSSDNTWMPPWMRPSAGMQPARKRLAVLLIVAVLALVLIMRPLPATGQGTDAPNSSTASEHVVELSTAEADSVLDLIDDQALRIDLLEADLWEARQLAASDSTLAADRLEVLERSYEEIIKAYRDDRDNWVERLTKSPLVWFALGVWLSGQAQ